MEEAKKPQGFASLKLSDPERARELSARGGGEVQRKGSGHSWTPEEAREAGKKGGKSKKPVTNENP